MSSMGFRIINHGNSIMKKITTRARVLLECTFIYKMCNKHGVLANVT